jgi:hypothetical protein
MSVSNSFAGSNSAFTVTSPTYTFTVINPAPVNVSVTVGASFAYGQPIPMTVRSTDANGDLVAQHIVVSNSSYTTNNWEGTDPSGWKWHHFMSVSTPLNGDTTSSFTLVDNNFGQGSNLPPGTYHVTLNTQDTLPNYTYDPSNVMATFTVGLAPAITSALTKDGVANVALTPTYLITATNSPTSYSASGLPAGLSVNTSTGVISGTPTGSGTTNVTISATNAYGTGSATLQITVSLSGAPVITSTLGKTGTVSMPLSPAYLITGSNAPTSYSATGLPAGLSVNTSTGAITGLPTASGVTYATISATNSYGTGSATLTFTVNSSVPDTTNSLELKIHVPTP